MKGTLGLSFTGNKNRMLEELPGRVVVMKEGYEIKLSELCKVIYKKEYEEKFKQRWKKARGRGGGV